MSRDAVAAEPCAMCKCRTYPVCCWVMCETGFVLCDWCQSGGEANDKLKMHTGVDILPLRQYASKLEREWLKKYTDIALNVKKSMKF